MDHRTRNEFEHYCALAEIEKDPERFAKICRSINRLLEAKQAVLCLQRPLGRVQDAAMSSTMEEQEYRAPHINSEIVTRKIIGTMSSLFSHILRM